MTTTHNVLAFFAGKERPLGGCEIYRVTMPYYWLEKKLGWKADWTFFEPFLMEFLRDRTILARVLSTYDLFVFPRYYIPDSTPPEVKRVMLDVFDIFRKMGKAIIYEVDDDYTNLDRQVIDGDAMIVASAASAVTVTTQILADLMTEKSGRKSYVLPNMFSPDVFFDEPPRKVTDKVVIGLTGSGSHVRDWEVLKEVIPVLVDRPDVHVVIGGFHPDYIADHENISFVPALEYGQYVQLIQALDIVLAPVNGEQFNLYKSPIKAVEGMAARRPVGDSFGGAAVIASDNAVYRQAVEHGNTGLLVAYDPSAWLNAIEGLVEDEQTRQRFQLKGHERVCRTRDISKHVDLWANAYQAVLRRELTQ